MDSRRMTGAVRGLYDNLFRNTVVDCCEIAGCRKGHGSRL